MWPAGATWHSHVLCAGHLAPVTKIIYAAEQEKKKKDSAETNA